MVDTGLAPTVDASSGGGETRPASLPDVVIYYNGTFVFGRNGAHSRMMALLRFLISISASVTLFSFENHPTEPWTLEARLAFAEQFPTVRLVVETQGWALTLLKTIKNALAAVFAQRLPEILSFRWAGASPKFEALAAEKSSAVWVVNYADGLTQLNGLPKAPIVVETHDLKSVSTAKARGQSIYSWRSLLRMRGEIAMLNAVSGVIAISPTEAGFFRSVLQGPQIFYVPGYDADAPTLLFPPASEHSYDFVFVGSEMNHNVRGFLDFCRAHESWLPTVRIAVCGLVCNDPDVQRYAASRSYINLLGFVDDISAVYAASKCAISPVDGTGMKIKVVEALRHGKPVFASRHSMDGLALGYDHCVFPLDPARMQSLLADRVGLQAAGTEALRYWNGLSQSGDLKALQHFILNATVR